MSFFRAIRTSSRRFSSLSTSHVKPSEVYNEQVQIGSLTFDAKQAAITRRYLDRLCTRLDGYTLPVLPRKSQLDKSKQKEQTFMVPRGLYIHGGIGTGKTMLLGLLFSCAKVPKKRRIHFHEFMLEVQVLLAQGKKQMLQRYGRQRHIVLDENRDEMLRVAHAIAEKSHLLCLDEFQVTDVADALMMRKLFGALFARGVVLVATSNTQPQDLYKNGTNRDYFLPFLDLLAQHTKVVPLDSNVDYRFLCERVRGDETFLTPLTAATEQKMDDLYQALLMLGDKKTETLQDESLCIPVMMGRTLEVRGRAQSGVCRASFSFLCDTEKGAADYKALAERFHTLVLDNVPVLSIAQHNQARRFILLVDELYEHHTRLVMSSEAPDPQSIFQFDEAALETISSLTSDEEKLRVNSENQAVGVPTTSSWDGPVGSYGPMMTGLDVGDLVALKDLTLACKRTVSRLFEMQGIKYSQRQ